MFKPSSYLEAINSQIQTNFPSVKIRLVVEQIDNAAMEDSMVTYSVLLAEAESQPNHQL